MQKIVSCLFFGFLSLASIAGLHQFVVERAFEFHAYVVGVICIFIGYFLIGPSLDRGFFRTFEHELTHGVVAILCGEKVTHFFATSSEGGYLRSTGKHNVIISLAPYFMPLTAVFFAMMSLFVHSFVQWIPSLLTMVALGYHALAVKDELCIGQSDIRRHGRLYSAVVIVCLGLVFLCILLSAVTAGWSGLQDYVLNTFWFGVKMSKWIIFRFGRTLMSWM